MEEIWEGAGLMKKSKERFSRKQRKGCQMLWKTSSQRTEKLSLELDCGDVAWPR